MYGGVRQDGFGGGGGGYGVGGRNKLGKGVRVGGAVQGGIDQECGDSMILPGRKGSKGDGGAGGA